LPKGAVIEIGPGIGSLTEQLARVAKHVTAYEVDPDLPAVLADTLKEYPNVEIILQDFLTIDLSAKVKELKEQIRYRYRLCQPAVLCHNTDPVQDL
jgi:16S rRNA (adenine1518-N6/adenine1519-N6)-dimethyltransferase